MREGQGRCGLTENISKERFKVHLTRPFLYFLYFILSVTGNAVVTTRRDAFLVSAPLVLWLDPRSGRESQRPWSKY